VIGINASGSRLEEMTGRLRRFHISKKKLATSQVTANAHRRMQARVGKLNHFAGNVGARASTRDLNLFDFLVAANNDH
jgi:hypothetical protein